MQWGQWSRVTCRTVVEIINRCRWKHQLCRLQRDLHMWTFGSQLESCLCTLHQSDSHLSWCKIRCIISTTRRPHVKWLPVIRQTMADWRLRPSSAANKLFTSMCAQGNQVCQHVFAARIALFCGSSMWSAKQHEKIRRRRGKESTMMFMKPPCLGHL